MKEPEPIPSVDPRRHPVSWRLTFGFDGATIRLLRREAVEMISPASVGPLPKAGEHAGSWLELRDGNDRVLFVRRLHDPLRTLAEHHSPDGRIEVVVRAAGRGEFEAIVPALPQARSAVLMSSALADGRSSGKATEVGRFPLGDVHGDTPQSGDGGTPPRATRSGPAGKSATKRGRKSS